MDRIFDLTPELIDKSRRSRLLDFNSRLLEIAPHDATPKTLRPLLRYFVRIAGLGILRIARHELYQGKVRDVLREFLRLREMTWRQGMPFPSRVFNVKFHGSTILYFDTDGTWIEPKVAKILPSARPEACRKPTNFPHGDKLICECADLVIERLKSLEIERSRLLKSLQSVGNHYPDREIERFVRRSGIVLMLLSFLRYLVGSMIRPDVPGSRHFWTEQENYRDALFESVPDIISAALLTCRPDVLKKPLIIAPSRLVWSIGGSGNGGRAKCAVRPGRRPLIAAVGRTGPS